MCCSKVEPRDASWFASYHSIATCIPPPPHAHRPSTHSRPILVAIMASTKQAPTRQAITLKGSTNLVTEFFKFAANTCV